VNTLFSLYTDARPEIQAAYIGVAGALIGGLVASILTGWFTVAATNRAHRQQRERDAEERRQRTIAFVQAVQTEIEQLFVSLNTDVFPSIDRIETNKPMEARYWEGETRLDVYRSNAELLGNIDSLDARRSIVKAYAAADALVSALKMNDSLLQQRDAARKEATIQSGFPQFGNIVRAIEVQLGSFAAGLVPKRRDFEKMVTEMFDRTNKWLNAQGAKGTPPPMDAKVET
jgi:hypothetical protein